MRLILIDFEGGLSSDFNVEMSLIFCQILGPLVLGWAPYHFVLGAQLAPGEKILVCIPDLIIFDYNRSSIETS